MGRNKEFDYEQKLDLALNLFWEQGYHVTSITELESHMGINRSSIYPTYGDKRDLLIKCLEKYLNSKVLAYSNSIEESQLDATTDLRRMLRLAVDESIKEERICLAIKMAFEIAPNDEGIRQLLAVNEKKIELVYLKVIKNGQLSGQLKDDLDPNLTAALFASASSALLKKYALNKDSIEVYRMIDALIKMLKAN